MKKILISLSVFIFLCNYLYADILEEIDTQRKLAIDYNDSSFDEILDNFIKLNDLITEYYESINWYNVTQEEKDKIIDINEPSTLGVIVFNKYSQDDGLEILFVEAKALSVGALMYLDMLYKYSWEFVVDNEALNQNIFDLFIDLANEEIGKPNLFLGIYYVYGLGVKQDFNIAKQYLELSQKNSTFPESYHYLGYCYYYTNEVEKAIEQWEIGLSLDYADSGYELGVYYRDNEMYDKAFEYFTKTLALNELDAYANANMAELYLNGWGVEVNPYIAINYLDKVIEIDPNEPIALNLLGVAYLELGNNKLAIEYFTRSANLGYEYAKYNLEKYNIGN